MIFLSYFQLGTAQKTDRVDSLLTHLSNPRSKHVMVAAHRGDWFWAPENSLRGFQNCIEMGVDIIELDVRLSKDRVPVIIHDLTLERTTNGQGNVSDWPLDSLKTLYLKDATGVLTPERIPTLEEAMNLTKSKILIYLDKSADKVEQVLPILEKTGTLKQAVFVLDFPYAKAEAQFGSYLSQVIYIPAVADGMKDLDKYVSEYLYRLQPKAFQFRMKSADGAAYPLLPTVLHTSSKAFVAATWPEHTIGHDDQVSRNNPEAGWGWLIREGFTILETNRPQQLLSYLRGKKLHD
jgi:glycerophosphoryl diester phosphodiesterase